MFCPSCGASENTSVRFCRSCGTNLGVVRDILEVSDKNATSIINAREEIARAAAEKIKTGNWWQVAAIVPEVEKLFESPEERKARHQLVLAEQRMSRLRGGTITGLVGLGLILLSFMVGLDEKLFFISIGLSFLVLLIGLGIIINGLFFSLSVKNKDRVLPESIYPDQENQISDYQAPEKFFSNNKPDFQHLSVVENTTQNLVEIPKRNTNKIKKK
ncbi:MAG: zinc ribbon domain-containing protein [Pyrinomonadaceae bacterium]|nr:zinc ribbon domain-containing protein [Pyrinomonadaceae bacterium]